MAFITAPDFRLKRIDWSMDRPAQINVSAFSDKRTGGSSLYGKWRASVELAVLDDPDAYRLLKSFFVRCQGTLNTFRLYAVVELQNSDSGVTVGTTASAGATSMTLSGFTTPLLEGQMVTVNDQLLTVTADQGSGATIAFEPALRADATAGTSVETSRPWALVRLAGQVGWTVDPPTRFSASFDVEEAF